MNSHVRQAGEHLVVAELGRRDITATPFAGNVPEIDILAYRDRRTTHIQVKTIASATWQLNAADYLDIRFEGSVQQILDVRTDVDQNLIMAFVKLGEHHSQDELFFLTKSQLQEIILKNHQTFLHRHNGIRPKNPLSTHTAVSINDLLPFKDNWILVEDQLRTLSGSVKEVTNDHDSRRQP